MLSCPCSAHLDLAHTFRFYPRWHRAKMGQGTQDMIAVPGIDLREEIRWTWAEKENWHIFHIFHCYQQMDTNGWF